jgi:hypothetical protein
LTTLYREMPPAREPHRFAPGRPVERLGDRCSPVDDDGFARLVRDCESTDVKTLDLLGALRITVDPAEDQCGITEVELRQAVDERLIEDVAFVARLESAAETGLGQVAQFPRIGSALLEARVGVVDEGLFFGDIGVRRGHVVSCIRPFLGSVEPTHATRESARAAHTFGRDRVTLSPTRSQ